MPPHPQMTLRSPVILRSLMDTKGHNTVTLAARVGRTKQFIADLTSGRKRTCRHVTATAIATELEVGADDLFNVGRTPVQIIEEVRGRVLDLFDIALSTPSSLADDKDFSPEIS